MRDLVNGFEGVVVARAEYAYSVPQVLVVAETKQAASDSRWIDEGGVVPAEDHAPGFHRIGGDAA